MPIAIRANKAGSLFTSILRSNRHVVTQFRPARVGGVHPQTKSSFARRGRDIGEATLGSDALRFVARGYEQNSSCVDFNTRKRDELSSVLSKECLQLNV